MFSLTNSAVNTTLPAFAAERLAAAPLLLSAGARRCRSISPARKATIRLMLFPVHRIRPCSQDLGSIANVYQRLPPIRKKKHFAL